MKEAESWISDGEVGALSMKINKLNQIREERSKHSIVAQVEEYASMGNE